MYGMGFVMMGVGVGTVGVGLWEEYVGRYIAFS